MEIPNNIIFFITLGSVSIFMLIVAAWSLVRIIKILREIVEELRKM